MTTQPVCLHLIEDSDIDKLVYPIHLDLGQANTKNPDLGIRGVHFTHTHTNLRHCMITEWLSWEDLPYIS